MHIHPIKVWDRYSPQMFLPHLVASENWLPLSKVVKLQKYWPRPINHHCSTQCDRWPRGKAFIKNSSTTVKPPSGFDETDPEQLALKQELSRMLIGNHPIFNRLADRYFTLDDLFAIRNRLIGAGRIGGKAAGMLLARRILLTEKDETGMTLPNG